MSDKTLEERIAALEMQSANICLKVAELHGSLKEIRDNHLVHLRRQIEDIRLDLTKQLFELAAEVKARDAELDKRLAVLAVKVGVVVSLISVFLNHIIGGVFE